MKGSTTIRRAEIGGRDMAESDKGIHGYYVPRENGNPQGYAERGEGKAVGKGGNTRTET